MTERRLRLYAYWGYKKGRASHTPLRYRQEPTREYERHAHKEYIKIFNADVVLPTLFLWLKTDGFQGKRYRKPHRLHH